MTLTEPIQADMSWQTSRERLPKKKTKHLEQVFPNKGPPANMGILFFIQSFELEIAIQTS